MSKRRTRGGRISQRGFWLVWAGLSMFIVIPVVIGIAHPPDVVIQVLTVLMLVMVIVGLVIASYGRRMIDRDLAEYDRKVAAGELPKWKPGDPNPLG